MYYHVNLPFNFLFAFLGDKALTEFGLLLKEFAPRGKN